jgi:hypothetical protein
MSSSMPLRPRGTAGLCSDAPSPRSASARRCCSPILCSWSPSSMSSAGAAPIRRSPKGKRTVWANRIALLAADELNGRRCRFAWFRLGEQRQARGSRCQLRCFTTGRERDVSYATTDAATIRSLGKGHDDPALVAKRPVSTGTTSRQASHSRMPSSKASTAACATNCSTRPCSSRWPTSAQLSWPGAMITTPFGRTVRSAICRQRSTPRHARAPSRSPRSSGASVASQRSLLGLGGRKTQPCAAHSTFRGNVRCGRVRGRRWD